MLVLPMFAMVPAYALLLPVAAGLAPAPAGFAVLAIGALAIGLLVGPMDIALFTVRQRRTDPAWMGRAFAVSMAANFMGFPIGAAIGGTLAAISLSSAVVAGVAMLVIGAILGALMIPRRDPGLSPAERTGRAPSQESTDPS